MTQEEVLGVFRETGALLEGHFKLSSGRHSNQYLEKFAVLQFPPLLEKLCLEIAAKFSGEEIDVVLGPTTGGVLIAYETARILRTRSIFAEREGETRVLRRGFAIHAGERVLVVDDIMTTGGALLETLPVVFESPGELVGACVLADRSGGKVDVGCRLEALVTLDIPNWPAEECPLCAKGLALESPGSKFLAGVK